MEITPYHLRLFLKWAHHGDTIKFYLSSQEGKTLYVLVNTTQDRCVVVSEEFFFEGTDKEIL